MAKLRKRPAKENPAHIFTYQPEKRNYIIRRMKAPVIEIVYDPVSKTGEFLNTVKPVDDVREIHAAVTKAIAWAKHNIKT